MTDYLEWALTRRVLPALVLLLGIASAAQGQTGRAASSAEAAKNPSAKSTSASSSTPPGTPTPTASMTITGDREAPLVLSIIPWADPKAIVPPDVPLQVLLPKVIDYNRSLLDEPINRAVGAPQRAPVSSQ